MNAPEAADVTCLGPRTRLRGVRASTEDRRAWLADFAPCTALAQHQIIHIGRADAVAPYRIVRAHQANSYFLACLSGEGRVFADGRWQPCRAGHAWLLPPHIFNAFHAVGAKPWEFCWVCYHHPPEQRPLASVNSPVTARFDGRALACAVDGLLAECAASGAPAVVHHWVELVHGYVTRFAQPYRGDDHLHRLWSTVEGRIAEDWTLDALARIACLSKEHLRRLCRRQLGRSPIQHVIHLRMRRATELLVSTDDKIERVANEVGYENPFVFSNTFKKWVGCRPSEYRMTRAAGSVERVLR